MVENAKEVPQSCAALAAQLVVEGALPIIRGDVKGKAPTEPVVLSVQDRAKLGRTGDGATLFYASGDSGVFFDAEPTSITVWFDGEDCDKATKSLHDRLMRAFPNAKQLDDVPHPKDKSKRARAYRVELGKGRLAMVKTSFTELSSGKERFTVEVDALQR